MSKAVKAHIGAAISFCIVGVLGSVKLRQSSLIGEPSLVALIVFTVLISLLIAFMWKVESFKAGATSIEVKLREIKEAETNIRQMASAILELAEADEGGFKQESWDRERYEKAKEHLRIFTK